MATALGKQVFVFWEGVWTLRRHFEGSYAGTFEGEAEFTAEADGMLAYHYTEQGELTDAEGKQFGARQNYRYQLAADKIQVLKQEVSDWTPMHDLEFHMEDDIAVARHTHQCGQDYYEAVYRIDFSGQWELAYRVIGPKKDYCIHSLYSEKRLSNK